MAAENPQSNPQEHAQGHEYERFIQDKVRPSVDTHMADMDKLIEDKLASKEYVEAYDNQKAKAVDAMKAYVRRSYAILEATMQNTDNPQDRGKWEKFLTECEDEVTQYKVLIAGFIDEKLKDEKGNPTKEIDLDELFELAERGSEIYKEISADPHYAQIMHKITDPHHPELDATDYAFILGKFPDRTPGELLKEDNIKLMEASGAMSLMVAMDMPHREKFMEHIIDSESYGSTKPLVMLTSLTAVKYLTISQAEKLLDDMTKKGQIKEEEKGTALQNMKLEQEQREATLKNVHEALRRKMDINTAVKFGQPRYLAGTALILWRGINLAISLVAYRKNLPELLKSPYFYADIAGLIAGNALLGNPTVWDWFKKGNDGSKEAIEKKAHVAERIMNAPDLSKQFFEQQGMVEAIAFVRDKKHTAGNGETVTLKEVMAAVRDPANKEKQFVKAIKANAKLMHDLEEAEQGDHAKIDDFILKIAQVSYIVTTDQYRKDVKELRTLQGLPLEPEPAPTSPTEKNG